MREQMTTTAGAGQGPSIASDIKPIETVYAGCHFRSRLEARWAVFFDTLGVQWEYEPQGYELSSGSRYLPDFYLPGTDQWVEVKGVLSHADFIRIATAAVEFPVADRPLQIRPGVLLLGAIPKPGVQATHSRMAALADDVLWQSVFFTSAGAARPIGDSAVFRLDGMAGLTEQATRVLRGGALAAVGEEHLSLAPEVDAAYQAARSARFEHGEQG